MPSQNNFPQNSMGAMVKGPRDAVKFQPFETLITWGLVNSIFGQAACTVKHAQGSTHVGGVMMDFDRIVNRKDSDVGDALVGLTRNSDSSKTGVAHVAILVNKTMALEKQRKKHREQTKARLAHFMIKL